MNPPLRAEMDRKAVLEAVLDGTIDCIVTDHAPHTKEEKQDFEKAPNGVVGLETSLAVTLTQLYHTKKATLSDIVRLMSENPRKVLKLEQVTLKEGSKADITIVDLEKVWTVDPQKLVSKSKNSVFKGETLKGKVLYTISKGKIIFGNI
jgi:dihydroorotase